MRSRLRTKLLIDTIIECSKSLHIAIDINTPKETIEESLSCLQQEMKSIHKNVANKRDDIMQNNKNYSKDIGDEDRAKRLR